jgi:hypothetical protein
MKEPSLVLIKGVDVGDITLAVLLIVGLVIIIETAFAAAFILMWRREELGNASTSVSSIS